MANNPQQSKNATDQAMAALEDALNVHISTPRSEPRLDTPIAPDKTDTFEFDAAADADLFREPEPARPSGAGTDTEAPSQWLNADGSPRLPANDDRASMGVVLQGLRRRRARAPYAIATVVSIVWAAGAAALAFLARGELSTLLATPNVAIATVAGIVAAVVVPVIFFYVLAHLFSRSQDLRLVAESMAEVAMRLAQPETAAREQIVSVGQAIRREVTAMGDGVERALARAAELEALVHNEVSALERAYNDNEVRIRDLLSELSNQRDTLVSQADQVRKAIGAVHLDLSHDITSVGDLVAEKVNEVAQRVTRSLTEKGEHITLALGHAGDSMIDALGERGSTLLERLETTSDRATTAIASASDRLADSLNFKTDHIHDEFSEMAARLQQMMTTRLDQVAQGFAQKTSGTIDTMASRSQQFTDALAQTSAKIADQMASRTDEISTRLHANSDALVQTIGARGTEIVALIEQTGTHTNETLAARSQSVADTFRRNADLLAASLDNRNEQTEAMLAERLKAFEAVFEHKGTALSEKIERDSAALGTLITRHVTDFDHNIKTYGGALIERLGQRTQDVADAMRAYLDSFDERVTGRADALSTTLDKRLVQFEDLLGVRVSDMANTLTDGGNEIIGALDKRIGDVTGVINARGTEVADAITAKIDEMDKTLGSRAVEVADTLDGRIERFEDLLVNRTVAVTDQIENRTKSAADALNARLEELSGAIKTNTAEAETALTALASTTTEQIRQGASSAERSLINASDEIARNIVARAEEIAETVSKRTSEMTEVLSDRSGGVLHAITEKGQQFAADVAKATEQAIAEFDVKGVAFSRAVVDNGAEITRMINVAGETAANTVTRTLNDLQDTATKAIERSRATATATVSEMLEAHKMVSDDTTALFERLREANIMLQEVLSGSHENMSALENTLMLRVSEFVAAMTEVNGTTNEATNRVETTIVNFRELTAHALNDLSQLATQFDEHGRDLAKAAELITSSNRQTEEHVAQGRSQIDSLVATLDIRTDDIEQRLKRFAGLLDQSLEAASSRAREVARLVSDSSAEGTRAITEQYALVRETAEEERRRTVETMNQVYAQTNSETESIFQDAQQRFAEAAKGMRRIYEQSSDETQAIFREATERFAETVQDMKQMAAEMQRELEATRGELRRGVFELPQETAENAAQMRRAIVDQIEALAELNRIVARHGRNLDAVEPTQRRSREEPTLAVIGGREASSRPEPAPRAALPPRPESFAQPSTRRVEPAAPAQPAASGNRGWLSDLLTRASREDGDQPLQPARDYSREPARDSARDRDRDTGRGDDRTARHSIESLDSLSVDIARMIDHEAAADLWDRYKRGERNVFTRRLYTLQGQQAFDEIRRKYRADREFKQTVDRYIGEFERLLEEVSRDDRGQVVARTYLTSETGKVYTMLAHAAGRFD
ncbi:MAG: hypothetical protein JSR61_10220 [Proteobacteria bacterium]|nr:hypothetical protein [Pseudomonadota bacterium]